MALDKRSLRKLRKRLPYSYSSATVTALLKAKRKVSPAYIRQVVNGERFDQQVIETLICMADKHQAEQTSLADRARGN